MSAMSPRNLYVHFPFCRHKCSYCALYSRCGVTGSERNAYVRHIASLIESGASFSTVYFGGGSPALCDLRPMFDVLKVGPGTEFTVELHPLDVTDETLATLREGGVNRVSMGVQSLDDATLAAMGRGYTAHEAEAAFAKVRGVFGNAGIDLIVGYPGDPCAGWERLRDWGLSHCSVYSLQNERGLEDVPEDDVVLDRIREVASCLKDMGLERYEISNYARPGCECRHNLAVWRGEDYLGLGDGACGRIGLRRTRNFGGRHPEEETVTAEQDALERRFFRLRTREGLDASGHPEWTASLAASVGEGLLTQEGESYRLTDRGTEVCDAILSDLMP